MGLKTSCPLKTFCIKVGKHNKRKHLWRSLFSPKNDIFSKHSFCGRPLVNKENLPLSNPGDDALVSFFFVNGPKNREKICTCYYNIYITDLLKILHI